jgi:hypothetical protein
LRRKYEALFRENVREAFLSDDAAKLNISPQRSGGPIGSINVIGSIDGPT